jgi:hypothetical protein
MNQDWDIKPRGEACHKCNVPFADKQIYFSALTFDKDGYLRADYCEACRLAKQDTTALTSYWQGTYHLPPPPQEEALKKETAESLLRGLMEKNDPTKINVIYILAVMLERKKILVEKDVQRNEDGTATRVYEHKLTGDSFLIREPHLRLDQLEHVQTEVIQLLGGPADKNKETNDGQPADSTAPGAPAGNEPAAQ